MKKTLDYTLESASQRLERNGIKVELKPSLLESLPPIILITARRPPGLCLLGAIHYLEKEHEAIFVPKNRTRVGVPLLFK